MTEEHYKLCQKYASHKMLPLGTKFVQKGVEYTIIGASQAGDKYRARTAEGQVLRFDIKNFEAKYRAKVLPADV